MAIITEYRIIQSTRELLSKKTQNIEELVGEEYSYTVQSQIDNNGKNYYPIFTVNASDVIAIYDRQTGKMNYTFGGIVSNDDIENTWVTYYSDVLPSTSDMSDYAVMTQDTSSARLKFGTSLDNIINIVKEDEDVLSNVHYSSNFRCLLPLTRRQNQ